MNNSCLKNGHSSFYIRHPDGDITSVSVPDGLHFSNYRAEILAICTAAEHLLGSGKKWKISPLLLTPCPPYQIIQGLHTSLAKLTARFPVYLQRVSVHVGLIGNETADKFAKIGCQALQTENSVTYREAKTLLNSRLNGDGKKENGGYQTHFDLIWRLELAQQTAVFRLRTWHGGPSAHLKEDWHFRHFLLFECGQADQTPDHAIQSCTKYAERRQLTLPHATDLAAKLWGSAENFYRTRQKASTGQPVLWHQLDRRSDLHGCR